MNREQIEVGTFAFFSVLAASDGSKLFKTAVRKVKHWEDVQPDDQPALLMRHTKERAEFRKGLPTRWWFTYELFIYVSTDAQMNPDALPSQLINPLLDAIDNALKPDDLDGHTATLGGLVSHCAINGDVLIFEGHLGNEAVVIVPIEVLATGN